MQAGCANVPSQVKGPEQHPNTALWNYSMREGLFPGRRGALLQCGMARTSKRNNKAFVGTL